MEELLAMGIQDPIVDPVAESLPARKSCLICRTIGAHFGINIDIAVRWEKAARAFLRRVGHEPRKMHARGGGLACIAPPLLRLPLPRDDRSVLL